MLRHAIPGCSLGLTCAGPSDIALRPKGCASLAVHGIGFLGLYPALPLSSVAGIAGCTAPDRVKALMGSN